MRVTEPGHPPEVGRRGNPVAGGGGRIKDFLWEISQRWRSNFSNMRLATCNTERRYRFLIACRLLLVAGACALPIGGCDSSTISSDWKHVEPPLAAPDFTLPQLDSGPVTLSQLHGRVVIMEFWATWCGPCRFSLPSLEVIAKQFRQREVTVLLIDAGESADVIRTWAEHRFRASSILLDQDDRVGRLYRVEGIPRLFIVDQAGRIVYAHAGYGGGLERNLTLILNELLSSTPSAPRTAVTNRSNATASI